MQYGSAAKLYNRLAVKREREVQLSNHAERERAFVKDWNDQASADK
jgi:hypothetical protein